MKWLYWVFAHGSMFLNALLGGRPYESVCGRAWRITLEEDPNPLAFLWACYTVCLMDKFDHRHCERAYKSSLLARKHLGMKV